MNFQNNENKKVARRRKAALVSSFLTAAAVAFTVYGAVTYDSSKDPVVAYSAMEKYVGEQLADIRTSIDNMSNDIEILKLTGGGGSGSGGGLSYDGVQLILDKIAALESKIATLESQNSTLTSQLASTRSELTSMIDDLVENHSTLEDEISDIKDSISSLNSQLSTTKTRVTTLEKNFKQISDISTKLEKVSYIVKSLNDDKVPDLREEVETLKKAYSDMLEQMGHAYEVVEVPVGATVYAKDADDTVLIILRSGAAKVISPYKTSGQTQGLNDLTDGVDLYDGDSLPTYHNVLIPRGGSDGRGVTVVGVDSAFMMIGGEYVIEYEQ